MEKKILAYLQDCLDLTISSQKYYYDLISSNKNEDQVKGYNRELDVLDRIKWEQEKTIKEILFMIHKAGV